MATDTRTAAQIAEEIKKMQRDLRATRRAEKKRTEADLLTASHALGVWLAALAGANSAIQVRALREALDTDDTRSALSRLLAKKLAPVPASVVENSNMPTSDPDGVDVDISTARERNFGAAERQDLDHVYASEHDRGGYES